MEFITSNADILENDEVRRYFLTILESSLSSEEKYQQFIQFFKQSSELQEAILKYGLKLLNSNKEQKDAIIIEAAQDSGIWNLNEIVAQTEDTIVRAISRLKNSQHRDGGWGFKVEQSELWGTVYAVLSLHATRSLQELQLPENIQDMLRRGANWLDTNYTHWSAVHIGSDKGMPVYQTAIVLKCFCRLGDHYFPSSQGTAYKSLHKLSSTQNFDGGWDANIWADDAINPTRVWSEVGGTSFALQALAETGDKEFAEIAQKGMMWLIENQDPIGSWKTGSCAPGRANLDGISTVTKTCDALLGILAAKRLGANHREYEKSIEIGVEWLKNQENLVLDDNDEKIRCWGWDYSPYDLENYCMTLETLVQMPKASLPILTSNAQWLLNNQYKQDDDIEDGNWKSGHTARIVLSLIEFYKKLKEFSVFPETFR